MKAITKTFFLVLLILSFSKIHAQSDKEKAFELGKEAVKMMDDGKLDESIQLLEKAQRLDPSNFDLTYELAYAHYAKEEYMVAIATLEKIENKKGVTSRNYQLKGNSYDMLGQPEKAMDVYREGLKRFPNAGELFLEQGNVFWGKKKYIDALPFYEKGINVDPTFTTNYYRATKIYCASSESIWGVLYGEIFMLLETNYERKEEISALLFDTYKAAIHVESATSAGVSFSKFATMDPNAKEMKIPFQLIYGADMATGLALNLLSDSKELTLESLIAIRSNFLQVWFQGHNKDYPNVLFDFQKSVKDAGHFEAYNQWLFAYRPDGDFDAWREANTDKWKAFIGWWKENHFEITDKNHFSSGQF